MSKIRNILLLSTTLLFTHCNAPEPPNKKTFNQMTAERMTASDSVHENLRIIRGLKEESKVNVRMRLHALDLLVKCYEINKRNKLGLDTIINFENDEYRGNSY